MLGVQNSTQTDCRGSNATYKQGLQTNSWSSNRIRDVYSLPVAPLGLPKCSSVFDVHTRPRTTWTTGAVTQNFYGFCFPCHRFRTVQIPFYAVFGPFTVQRKRNGNFILMPTVHCTCTHVHVCVPSQCMESTELVRFAYRATQCSNIPVPYCD